MEPHGTSFYYFASDQWRYDCLRPATVFSPLAEQKPLQHMADDNTIAARPGMTALSPLAASMT